MLIVRPIFAIFNKVIIVKVYISHQICFLRDGINYRFVRYSINFRSKYNDI